MIKAPLMYPSHVIEELVQAGTVAIHCVSVATEAQFALFRQSEVGDTSSRRKGED